ncbi:MAG: hemolysin III family protein [Verrucomicrobia bacterium]|nr:hemolysin III family protein [Verrucomicrobiota bacterium]
MYKGERLNSISHLLGFALAVAGVAVLIVRASIRGNPWKIVSFSIYGAALILLYACSVLHHSLRGRAKRIFLHLDYQSIYVLIAASYTPLLLVTLRGGWGWTLFGVLWGLAVVGIVVDAFPHRGKRVIPITIYLLMGWISLVALAPLTRALPPSAIGLLLTGGLVYTSGLIFYALEGRLAHAHGIWHLFVMVGSLTHYLTLYVYVL